MSKSQKKDLMKKKFNQLKQLILQQLYITKYM
jgi:hypothetical protein